MEYYGNNDYRNYLVLRHHGILGMKWGKRNGPPYPLGAGDHSASEKRAGWRKFLADGKEERIKRRRDRYISKETKRAEKKYNSEIDNWKNRARKTQEKIDKAASKGNYKKEEILKGKKVNDLFNQYVAEGRKVAELDKIKNMSVSDVSEEKKKLAKEHVKAALVTAAGVVARASGSPLLIVELPDSRAVKTRNRISSEDDQKIQEKAFKKALVEKNSKGESAKLSNKIVADTPSKEERGYWSNGYPSEKIKTMISNARNNQKFNVDFLEAVQNKEIANKYDSASTSKLLKEYEKYLKNPENYWKNERGKLKDQ